MRLAYFTSHRVVMAYLKLLLVSALLYAGQALADLPPIEQPATGGGGGTYQMATGYIKMGALLLGLIVCVGAFLAVVHAVITSFHDIRRGKGSWTEFLLYLVVGIGLILLVIYLTTKAADIL